MSHKARVKTVRVNVFGDNLLEKLCPMLNTKLWIEVDEVLTISHGTIRKLLRTVSKKYKTKEKTKNTALLMIGTFDILKYNMRKSTEKAYVWNLKKQLKQLLGLLKETHQQVVVLTLLPILKLQDLQYHWNILKKYNKIVKKFSCSSVKIIDSVPFFLKEKHPPTCHSSLYEKTCCLGCPRSEVDILWNENGISRVLPSIIKTVLDIRTLKTARREVDVENNEKCLREAVMTSKLEDMSLADKSEQSSTLAWLTANGDKNNGTDKDLHPVSAGFADMEIVSDSELVSDTELDDTIDWVQERENELKGRLNTIRSIEYTNYGKDLVKSDKLQSVDGELLRIASYNVLSQTLLETHNYLYRNHDKKALKWKRRSRILLEEFSFLNADILCLQEVESSHVNSFYNHHLCKMGYHGVYKQRTNDKVDGCAIYFKKDKFRLLEARTVELFKPSIQLLDRDNIGIVLKLSLKNKTSKEFVVATTHLLYNPRRNDIKLAQTQLMLAEIESLAYKNQNDLSQSPEYLPIILTGDMNYSPESAVYELVTESCLTYHGKSSKFLTPCGRGPESILGKTLLPSRLGVTDSCQYAQSLSKREGEKLTCYGSGCLSHYLNLKSVYSHVKSGLPEATTNQDGWLTVDYIFYSCLGKINSRDRSDGKLKLVSKLTLPNTSELGEELRYLPNLACASDHLPLLATFQLAGD